MKRGLRLFLTVVLVNTVVFSFPLFETERLHAQGYEKLPDDIEHIKKEVTLDDLERKDMLKENAD